MAERYVWEGKKMEEFVTWLLNPTIELQRRCPKIYISFPFKKKNVLVKQHVIQHISCIAKIKPPLSSDNKCKSNSHVDLKFHTLIYYRICPWCSDIKPGNAVQKIIQKWKINVLGSKSYMFFYQEPTLFLLRSSTIFFLMLSNKIF